MKFMLLMFNDQSAWDQLTKSEQDGAVESLMKFGEELAAEGKMLASHGLAPPGEAVSVRRREGGDRLVVDGPYAETKEVVGGYYLIECDSKEEAVDWLKRLPLVTWGAEVRQVRVEQ